MISKENVQESSKQLNQYWADKAQSQLGIDHNLAQPEMSWPNITARRISSLALHHSLGLVLVEGESETLRRHTRLLIADDGRELQYILKLTGMTHAKQTPLGRVSACKPPKTRHDVDMTIMVSNRLLHKRFTDAGYYVIPGWVRLFLELAEDPEVTVRKMNSWVKSDMTKIRRMKLAHEICTDESQLDEFYHNMYVPHAQSRYGEIAIIRSRKRIMKSFKQGHLMMFKNDASAIAGCIMLPAGKVLTWPHMGIVNGDMELMRQGVSATMYWTTIKWAYNNGYKAINFGHSRAFINDGPFRYKLKWGMRIADDDDGIRDISIKFNPEREAAQAFMAENPFIHLRDGGLAVHSF